jgi:hypothetical protein
MIMILLLSFFKNTNLFDVNNFMHITFLILIINYNYIFKSFLSISNVNNTSLINGLLIIHPWYIYTTYILIFIYFFKNQNFLKNNHKINFSVKLNKNVILVAYCSLFSIFLGSYWAQQELNWGGWWNWDYVELIALIFFTIIMYIIHTKKLYVGISYYVFKSKYVFYMCLFYIIVRCDILNSVHSFNSLKILDKYIQYVYFSMMIVIIYTVFYSLKLKNFFNFKKHRTPLSILFAAFNTTFILLLIYNFIKFYYLESQTVMMDIFLKIIINIIVIVYLINQFKIKINFLQTIMLLLVSNLVLSLYTISLLIIYGLFCKKYFLQNIKNNITYFILHFLFLYSTCIMVLGTQPIFINHLISDYLIHLNNFFINSNNTACFEQIFKNNFFKNNDNLDNISLINQSNNLNSSIIALVNTNMINFNNLIFYKLDDSLIFVHINNLTYLLYSFVLVVFIIFYIKKTIFFKSDIV